MIDACGIEANFSEPHELNIVPALASGGCRGRMSVLCGVEPGVLAELFKLAGSVAGVGEEQFPILFVATFNGTLCPQKLWKNGGEPVACVCSSPLKLAEVELVETFFQDVVFEGEELSIRAGVALPSAAAAQLPIDPRRRVKLTADDVQAASLFRISLQSDVGSSTRHVSGDGHAAWLSGIGDDFCLASVIACVQELVLDSQIQQQCGKTF